MKKKIPFLLVFVSLILIGVGCGRGQSPNEPAPFIPSPQTDSLPAAGFYNNETETPVFQMIGGAQTSLDIEIYQMADADIRAGLRRALERGVRVRVVKEPSPLGDPCKLFELIQANEDALCLDQKKLRDEILSKGGSYVAFNKEELCANPDKPCFMHGKMVMADRTAVLLSTGNFNSSNLCNLAHNPSKCNRDFSVVLREPDVISFLGSVFEQDLKGVRYGLKEMLDAHPVQVTVSPFSLEPLVQFIQSAKVSVRVENQYLKEFNLNRALMDAAKRGVKVEVTLSSVCSFGPPAPRDREVLGRLFSGFEEAGLSIRMLPSQFLIKGKPGYLHSKAIVVDDAKAWVGSVNGSFSALSNNREFGVFFAHAEWVRSLTSVLRTDHASTDTETWQESLDCKKDGAGLQFSPDLTRLNLLH